MGMQINNLTAGNSALAPQQGQVQERRALNPAGQKNADSSQTRDVIADDAGHDSVELRNSDSNFDRSRLTFDRRLQFVVDRQSRDVTVKIIDRQTDKVIKELPPEELRRLHDGIRESIGSLYDSTV